MFARISHLFLAGAALLSAVTAVPIPQSSSFPQGELWFKAPESGVKLGAWQDGINGACGQVDDSIISKGQYIGIPAWAAGEWDRTIGGRAACGRSVTLHVGDDFWIGGLTVVDVNTSDLLTVPQAVYDRLTDQGQNSRDRNKTAASRYIAEWKIEKA